MVELLVVVGVLSTLMGILVPALGIVRRKAESLRCMSHLRQITSYANLYAMDHHDRYPTSVATMGIETSELNWNWYDPRTLVAPSSRTKADRRSVSAYLSGYLKDADLLCCPGAPDKPTTVQADWDAGDLWKSQNFVGARLSGHYAFYWNYEGMLNVDGTDLPKRLFRGPKGPASSGRYSKLLVSDYFGYGHTKDNAPPNSYASCESFAGGAAQNKDNIFPYWAMTYGDDSFPGEKTFPRVSLHAAFTDEHVESYQASETEAMWVIEDRDDMQHYEPGQGLGPGIFYLPETAIPQSKP